MSDLSWFAVEVVAAPQAADAVEHCLNELDALGTEIDQLRKKKDEDVTVVGYFEKLPDEVDLREQLTLTLNAFELDDSSIRSVAHRTVEDTDWLAEWKKHWRPTRVGRFVIAPTWYEVEAEPDTVLIRIEPNMAFGTGTHETTKLCLKALDEIYRPGMSFLDVGTGTGILAIAAAKLNRGSDAKIVGVELDPDSVKIARENVELNEVSEIEIVEGVLTNEMPSANLVCANLTLDVISPMLSLLTQKATRHLILSGILTEQEDQIIKELQDLGIDNPQVQRDGEWIAVRVAR